jgi:hypothetical protein
MHKRGGEGGAAFGGGGEKNPGVKGAGLTLPLKLGKMSVMCWNLTGSGEIGRIQMLKPRHWLAIQVQREMKRLWILGNQRRGSALIPVDWLVAMVDRTVGVGGDGGILRAIPLGFPSLRVHIVPRSVRLMPLRFPSRRD